MDAWWMGSQLELGFICITRSWNSASKKLLPVTTIEKSHTHPFSRSKSILRVWAQSQIQSSLTNEEARSSQGSILKYHCKYMINISHFPRNSEASYQNKYVLGKEEFPDHSRGYKANIAVDSDSKKSKIPLYPSLEQGSCKQDNEWNSGPCPSQRGQMGLLTSVQLLPIPLCNQDWFLDWRNKSNGVWKGQEEVSKPALLCLRRNFRN